MLSISLRVICRPEVAVGPTSSDLCGVWRQRSEESQHNFSKYNNGGINNCCSGLDKLKQLRWNQWSLAFSYWISQSPYLWCLSSILLLVMWNMAYVQRSWWSRQLWREKSHASNLVSVFLQRCFSSCCTRNSFSLLLEARDSNLTPVMTLPTHCYPQSPACCPLKPSFHSRKCNWISFAANFWLASY